MADIEQFGTAESLRDEVSRVGQDSTLAPEPLNQIEPAVSGVVKRGTAALTTPGMSIPSLLAFIIAVVHGRATGVYICIAGVPYTLLWILLVEYGYLDPSQAGVQGGLSQRCTGADERV